MCIPRDKRFFSASQMSFSPGKKSGKKNGKLRKSIREDWTIISGIRLFGVFVDFFCSEAVYYQNELKG